MCYEELPFMTMTIFLHIQFCWWSTNVCNCYVMDWHISISERRVTICDKMSLDSFVRPSPRVLIFITLSVLSMSSMYLGAFKCKGQIKVLSGE